jgi:lysophospholipase L1-like esterase
MKDQKLTELMLKSLKKDPQLASADEWDKAGDFAKDMRFFPHAFNCYQLSVKLTPQETVVNKLDDMLDKITNVLAYVPEDIKADIEEFRFNNPLDPAKWLALTNKLLKGDQSKRAAIKFSLSMCIYCAIRSGLDVAPMNQALIEFLDEDELNEAELKNYKIKPSEYQRAVALGDNVTLGLQQNWEIKFDETFHHLWNKELKKPLMMANCGVSGAGILDAVLYLERDVINYKPELVLINYGINDAWLGLASLFAYESLLEFVVKTLLDQGMKVVIVGAVPHLPENCPEALRPNVGVNIKEVEIESWLKISKQVAARLKVPYADTAAKFPRDKAERAKYFANGFNQPNISGHRLMKAALDDLTVNT